MEGYGSAILKLPSVLADGSLHTYLEETPALDILKPGSEVEVLLVEEVVEVEELEDYFLGEYFDPLYIENTPEEEQVENVFQKEPSDFFSEANEFESSGEYLKALEHYILALKLSRDKSTGLQSCLRMAAIYKSMGQPQQAEFILNYYLKT